MTEYRFCPSCGSPLSWVPQMEDGGEKLRLRCTQCDFTHWNNPTPVLAGIVQVGDQILLARNAAWTCLLYTSPSPRDRQKSRMPSSA